MTTKTKILSVILGLALVAVMVPAGASAAALTSGQVSAIVSLLQSFGADAATIANVQASLTGGTPGATPVPTGVVACAGVTFTRTLTVGSTGQDVKCLQVLMNTNGYTLAATGAGSPGMETSYFGPATLTAVRAFQTAKGWVPANQVGPMTIAALNALIATSPTIPPVVPPVTGGVEGSITVTKSVSPISGQEMNVNATAAVAGVDVKATGSDVVVNRLDVTFNAISGTSCNVRPWTNISELTVSDGTTSKTVAVTQANTTEVTVGSVYSVRAEGLTMPVAKDTTKKLTVSVKAAASLPAGATTCTPTIQVLANGVRATDGAGISQTGPATALSASTFVVKTGDTGTLTVSVAADSPKARNVIIGENSQTDNVVLAKFSVEAKSNDVVLRTVRIQANSSDTLATVMPTVKLLDGTTELAATSTAASSTFDALTTVVAKGTTKVFTVVGVIAKQSGNYSEGTWVSASVDAADVVGEDVSNFATVTAGGSTVAGVNTYGYLKAPVFALVSSSITNVPGTSGSSSQAADAVIRFNVTANGGDVYVRNVSAVAASSGVVTSAQTGDATSTVAFSFTTNATSGTNAWKVSSGDTKYFEVNTRLTNTTEYAVGYYAGAQLLNVKWATTDSAIDGNYSAQTWGLDDIKTGTVYLNPVL